MRRIFLFILFFTSLNLAQAEKQKLSVGIRSNYPPYEFTSNERIIGFNIDILNQLSDLFSYDLEFVKGEKETLQQMLDSGRIDFISFCFQSQENKADYNLSIPYNMVSFGIYIPYQSSIQHPQDIMPYKVSLRNELLYEMMRNNKKFAGHLTLRRSQNQCLQDVINGDADAAIISSLSGKYLIERHNYKMIKVPPINFKNLQYSFAFSKTNDSLLVQFNEGLNILRETGTYNRIYQKWFGEVHPKQIKETKSVVYWPYYVLSLIVVVLIILFINQRRKYAYLKHLKTKEIEIRHNAEKTLYDYQLIVEGMVDTLPHIIVAQDEDKKIRLVNKAFLQLIGQPKDEVLNKKIDTNSLPDKNLISLLEHEGDDQSALNYHMKLVDTNSRMRTFDLTKRKIKKATSKEIISILVGIDITEREQQGEALRQEKALLTSLINSIPDLIFYKDRTLKYMGANNAFKAFNNFKSEKEFVGKTDYNIFDEKRAKEYKRTDQEILNTKERIELSSWETDEKGKKILYDTLKVPIIDHNGELTGIVGISRDITQQADIQRQLHRAKSKAEESDKLKTIFLTNLSHEIRTPLNSIIGFSDLLTDPDLTDDQREEFTELISKSGASLLTLVDDIIDLSKIEANQIQINKDRFNINQMLVDLHEAIEENRDAAHKHAVSLEYYIPGNEDQALYFEHDDFRIRQVLSNLIKNALKYTNKGEVKFGYRLTEDEIVFFVKDTGLGISEQDKAHIFEHYNSGKSIEQFGGSGLGLSISKKLVEILGGKIDFTTDELKGSEFFFSFPLDKHDTSHDTARTELAETYDWSDIQILVAEDEQNNFMFIKEALKNTGAKIIWAEDGQKAVEEAQRNPKIDLVLMDIKMPKLNGYEATKQIKKIRSDLPIIAQTAYAMSDEKDLSLQAGCDEYLTKPIRPKKLLKKINQLL
ncbi:response regulator [Salinivirga cyanobacteriivorans]